MHVHRERARTPAVGFLPTVPSQRIGCRLRGVAKVAVELAATAYNESVVAGAARLVRRPMALRQAPSGCGSEYTMRIHKNRLPNRCLDRKDPTFSHKLPCRTLTK